ncbi:LLM class F420-dependent oxidoreductase [Blastococcus sp. URHD0036]|uniref:LLM class F420-dependent oxidoreductase n=1 Tax=Blastococcus sp. URHD0036 TaxID=1380356 RepID=UPI0004960809|nr:LLM class F420-dependent oxidoreductase [Blastococcus sp. URHD0036]
MKIAVLLRPVPDPRAAARLARAYEDAGVDVIATGESYGFDAVSWLGFLAAGTERVELAAHILSIYARTPATTAMTAAGLDHLSGGRFVLGLGASGPQVVEGWHAVPYDAPVARTREIVEICRTVWRREKLEHDGPRHPVPLPADRGTGAGKPLKLIDRPLRPRIPVHLAALGPANVELAAELAEGWVPYLYVPELADRVWGEPLARGLAKRDSALGTLDVTAAVPMAIGDDVTHLRDRDRAHLALYVGGMGPRGKNFYTQIVQRYGFEQEAAEVQDLYLEGRREEAAARLPDALLEGTSLIGDAGYVRDRLAAHRASGVTVLQVEPVGADPLGDIRRLRALVDES